MAHIRMSHGTHRNESRHTYLWCEVQKSGVKQFATHMLYHEINTLWIFFGKHLAYESCHVKRVISQTRMSNNAPPKHAQTRSTRCGHIAGNFPQALGLRVMSCCSASPYVAVRCSTVQCIAICCSALQYSAVHRHMLQCVAVQCSALQCVAVCCRACVTQAFCLSGRSRGNESCHTHTCQTMCHPRALKPNQYLAGTLLRAFVWI